MKFRTFTTSSRKEVLAGKSAENNEKLVAQVEKNEVVLHSAKPGSPFVNIKGKTTHKDIKESAVFCARYSKDWRDNKRDVVVHYFLGSDIFKLKLMKAGTFGVKKFKEIRVKKKEIEEFLCQKNNQ